MTDDNGGLDGGLDGALQLSDELQSGDSSSSFEKGFTDASLRDVDDGIEFHDPFLQNVIVSFPGGKS